MRYTSGLLRIVGAHAMNVPGSLRNIFEGNTYEALHKLTRSERKKMAADYVNIPIAWLFDMHGKTWEEQHQRLQLIVSALDKDINALAQLDKLTSMYALRFGDKLRYGSIRRDTVDSFIGSYGAFGSQRVQWQRFATWVALRAITNHPKYKALRASYRHIAALSLGYPTIQDAVDDEYDLSPNRAIYRQVQRGIRAFKNVGLVLVWKQKGYRSNWYSYLLSDPKMAYEIASQRAEKEANKRETQKQIQKEVNKPTVIDQTIAEAIYNDVLSMGWHDTALRQIPVGVPVTATERIGNRQYVMLTRCNATDLTTQRARLHAVVGKYVRTG
jgi:hypothetical protein